MLVGPQAEGGLDVSWVEMASSSEFLIVRLSGEGMNYEVMGFWGFFFFSFCIGLFIKI